MTRKSTTGEKLKVLAVVEVVAVLISLALPVTPSKSGKPFHWPATWGAYFDEVLFAFLLTNMLLVVLFLAGWFFIRSGAGENGPEVTEPTEKNPAALPGDRLRNAGSVGSEAQGLSPETEFKPHGGQFHGDH